MTNEIRRRTVLEVIGAVSAGFAGVSSAETSGGRNVNEDHGIPYNVLAVNDRDRSTSLTLTFERRTEGGEIRTVNRLRYELSPNGSGDSSRKDGSDVPLGTPGLFDVVCRTDDGEEATLEGWSVPHASIPANQAVSVRVLESGVVVSPMIS